jgi:hypothetical protein
MDAIRQVCLIQLFLLTLKKVPTHISGRDNIWFLVCCRLGMPTICVHLSSPHQSPGKFLRGYTVAWEVDHELINCVLVELLSSPKLRALHLE